MRAALGVLSRTLAAIAGGYALAALVASAAALFLPLARVDAVLTGMMAGLLVQAGAAVWAFAARTAFLAWGGMALPGAALGTALLLQGGAMAR